MGFTWSRIRRGYNIQEHEQKNFNEHEFMILTCKVLGSYCHALSEYDLNQEVVLVACKNAKIW
jgi:hypothetical protein